MRFFLLPFSWLYGFVVYLRNRLYDWGFFKTNTFDVPLIVIGNLAVGGTGKTPHTEYIIRLLKGKKKVAVLSRGYGRKTRGYILADSASTPENIGDEPFQIHTKYPTIPLAVCEDRTHGINRLLQLDDPPEVILLDDAFQHRKITAGLNIVLTEVSNPFYRDYMIPMGRLRDNKREIRRAQVLIYTKIPANKRKGFSLPKKAYQGVKNFGSSYRYIASEPYFDNKTDAGVAKKIVVVTGIANPQPFVEYLRSNHEIVHEFTFADHHGFSPSNVDEILKKKRSFATERISVVTTEKDFVKLKSLVKEEDDFYYIPIEVEFLENANEFDQLINTYINTFKP